jgi:hypothetical protein
LLQDYLVVHLSNGHTFRNVSTVAGVCALRVPLVKKTNFVRHISWRRPRETCSPWPTSQYISRVAGCSAHGRCCETIWHGCCQCVSLCVRVAPETLVDSTRLLFFGTYESVEMSESSPRSLAPFARSHLHPRYRSRRWPLEASDLPCGVPILGASSHS